ncbi:copper-binding protein [Piscinibacter sp.]|uniref:copper-binding protein n=1 Tax=Piscinibacter sp. TaxID=1903157 RepID=UPI00391F5F89
MKKLVPLMFAVATALAWAGGPPASMTDGEVRKVDKANQKVTLKHGEIKNLDMPGMTMVFKVKEPGMLDALQPGDKVRFQADKVDGGFVVTAIEAVK